MEVVTHDGVEYTKATVLAEEFGYTTDYIGQLCRAKKVDARLVGRAWYVTQASLLTHKKSRYKTETVESSPLQKDTVASKVQQKHYESRLDVEPVLRNRAAKTLKSINNVAKEVSVRYEEDTQSLIPEVQKAAVEAEVPVALAEATPVPIRVQKRPESVLRPDPIPKVYLQGKLVVSDIPEKTSLAVHAGSKADLGVQTVNLAPVQQQTTTHEKRGLKGQKPEKILVKSSYLGKRSLRPERSIPTKPVGMHSFTPASVQTQLQHAQVSAYEESRTPYALAIFFGFLLAVVTSTALLTVQLDIEVESGVSVERMSFQPAALIEFFRPYLPL